MAKLRQVLADHGNLLVLDAASTTVQVGVFTAGNPPRWSRSQGDATAALFKSVDLALGESQLAINDIRAFAYCEGPGSMLGTRTIVMALRTWLVLSARPVFSYQSLGVAGRHEWLRTSPRDFSVIADARRDSWHCVSIAEDGNAGELRRVATSQLPDGELMSPEGFRCWSALERTLPACSYDLANIFDALADEDFLRRIEKPSALAHEPQDYKKWSAQTHSAETAGRK